jgi:hypothetical protein
MNRGTDRNELPAGAAQMHMSCLIHKIRAWYPDEVTFEEVRAHLGFETQRPGSGRTLGRTTPCLLGLLSMVVLLGSGVAPGSPRMKP